MQGPSHRAATAANSSARVVAIVGGGFSGIAVATQLLRQRARDPLRIVLIDPRAELGAGVAYATRDYPYPLNVAAGQMSLDTVAPNDFLEFANSRGIHASSGDYLPRQVYGEYLRERFGAARAAAPPQFACVHHRASVLQLRRAASGRWELWLDDGTALAADDVVLAIGNQPPACLPELEPIARTDRYVSDPWSIAASGGIDSVLLVGSGLTMIDAALRLAAIRPRVRHIRVLSRHGWLPLPQASEARPARKPDVRSALESARGSVRALTSTFAALLRANSSAGGDWREVLALARNQLPSHWRALDAAQRRRFLRHARALWDVHRHRAPSGPLSAVQSLARMGVLEIHAGRLEQVSLVDDAVEVLWRPRGQLRSRAWLVDRVVNCTGPEGRATSLADPLVKSLLSHGLVRSDELSLGIDVADDGRVIARDGTPVERLYYIGPWLRARDWEATAVPELREHALALARRLAEVPAAAMTSPP
jgi:uncharacterized NAD(P)/FAD-binding protein YdhS